MNTFLMLLGYIGCAVIFGAIVLCVVLGRGHPPRDRFDRVKTRRVI